MIGRSLQSKKYRYEWEKVEKSELWHLDYANNQILPWLLLSFNQLPTLSLKKCFAYCAIFPKDCSMQKGELIALWLAQGYLHKAEPSNLTMEEIGEEFLQILTNILFLQGEESEKTGQVLSYKMHDLVHDLALYVSRKELLVWKEEAGPSSTDIECRHIVGKFRIKQALPKSLEEVSTQKLRTLNIWAGLPLILFQARYLRTLMIEGIGLSMIPTAIEQLKLIRYLDLSNNPIKTLPESITKLYQLQTLKLTGCRQLTELPKELHRLVNIRHIPTTDHCVFVSQRLQQLTCLQTLPDLALRGEEGWTIDELGPLEELRDGLSISGLEHVKSGDDARKAKLGKKVKLLRLHLVWSVNRVAGSTDTDMEVLNGLEPYPGIIALAIISYNAENFPSWVMKMAVENGEPRSKLSALSNLKAIKLVNCKKCRDLPTLGMLPFLRYLYLDMLAVEHIDFHFYVSKEDRCKPIDTLFPSLRELQIWNFHSLIEWRQPPTELGAGTTFPCLEILEVMNCPKLETIPTLGIGSLKRLRIQQLAGAHSLDIIRYNTALTSLELCEISNMKSLPPEFSNCRFLQKLNIWGCQELVSLPAELQCPTSLKTLDIRQCPRFLQKLNIWGCQELVSLPAELHFPASLKTLDIRQCPALASLPDDLFQGLSSLYELSIFRCQGLKRISTSLQGCASLRELHIKQCSIIEDPLPDLKMLQGLEELGVVNAGKLTTSILQALQHLPSLMKLTIGGFTDEQEFQNYFRDTESLLINPSLGLKLLLLEGSPEVKSLPKQIHHFSAVKVLMIMNFDKLEELPDWIGNLSSLEELSISGCENLSCLPTSQVLLSLTEFWHLHIDACPLLAQRYAKDVGPEWHNISHLPYIEINDEIVQIKSRR